MYTYRFWVLCFAAFILWGWFLSRALRKRSFPGDTGTAVKRRSDREQKIPDGAPCTCLTEATSGRLNALFDGADRETAEKLLVTECGNNLPFLESSTCEELERVRFAALKLSKGNLERLREAIELAQADWRDLLVAADFANDLDAHKKWQP